MSLADFTCEQVFTEQELQYSREEFNKIKKERNILLSNIELKRLPTLRRKYLSRIYANRARKRRKVETKDIIRVLENQIKDLKTEIEKLKENKSSLQLDF